MSFIRKIEIEIVSTKHRELPNFSMSFRCPIIFIRKNICKYMGEKKEKRKNIRVQMRSPGNVKIKIVQFWKLQKKKYKTCNKNKSYKNPSIFKNSKNRKISRGKKKKKPTVQREANISWNLNFLLGIRKHARNKEGWKRDRGGSRETLKFVAE